jgi:hypothetical protein
VRPNASSRSRNRASKSITFQKGKPGQSTLLIGVQKGDEKKRLYDLNGREAKIHPAWAKRKEKR